MFAHFLELMGRFNEAIKEYKQALELEPLSININSCLGKSLYYSRKYDEAIEQLQKTIDMDPHYFDPYPFLGLAYAKKGLYKQAIEKLQEGIIFTGISPRMIAALASSYALAGKRNEAQNRLDELKKLRKKEHVDSHFVAWVYAALGKKKHAFKWLDKACEERSWYVILAKVDPTLDSLRSDPRFKALLKKMNLQ